ncbi:hypothetical protein LIA77_11644 [Sarocladium implicatum]|nr:hypothetical protein LIA77_11644 [Sarocladium implicatum]
MQAALHILGFPTYHSYHLMNGHTNSLELWTRFVDAKYGSGSLSEVRGRADVLSRLEFDKVLGDHMAVVDLPGSLFAVELAQHYPDAKVIVLNRDVDSWFRSCRGAWPFSFSSFGFTLFGWLMYWNPKVKAIQKYMVQLHAKVWDFEWPDADAEDKAKAFFHEYYSSCRESIPAERRMEFSVQEGWEPLCRYLGVEIPTVLLPGSKEHVQIPFPRANDAETIQKYQNGLMADLAKSGVRDWLGRIGVVVAFAETCYLTRSYWLPGYYAVAGAAAGLRFSSD